MKPSVIAIDRRPLIGLAAVFASLLIWLLGAPLQAAETKKIVMLGDSLTAGYGLPKGESLADALDERLTDASVVNAGISGDTTAGGLARLDGVIGEKPDLVLIALGANDMLRGVPPKSAKANLSTIIERLKDEEIPVALLGMQAASNCGPAYRKGFDAIYPDLARTYDVPLYPFLLEGVTQNAALNQEDGIHPNRKGVEIIAKRLAAFVKPLIGT